MSILTSLRVSPQRRIIIHILLPGSISLSFVSQVSEGEVHLSLRVIPPNQHIFEFYLPASYLLLVWGTLRVQEGHSEVAPVRCLPCTSAKFHYGDYLAEKPTYTSVMSTYESKKDIWICANKTLSIHA